MNWKLPLFFLMSMFSAQAEESPFRLAGRIYTDQYVPTRSGARKGFLQSSYSAWLDGTFQSSEKTSVRAIGQLDLFLSNLEKGTEPSAAFRLREGYFDYQNEAIEIKAGQQIIPWGKSDGVNPTDYFTAKDYTILNPDDEVRRIGTPSVLLNFTPEKGLSPVTITGVFQAAHPQAKLFIPDSVIPTGISFQKYAFAPAYFKADTIEFGGKISYLKNDFDFSVSAFRGVNHVAQYVYQSGGIVPVHIRQTAIGTDGSLTSGDYVIRFESAYTLPDRGKLGTEDFGILQPDHWDTTLGLERPFLEDFRVQFQVLYRYHPDQQDPADYTSGSALLIPVQRAIARANATLLNFQRRGNIGSTLRLSYSKDSDPISLEIFMVGYFTGGSDFLIRPQVTYKPIQNLSLILGSDTYAGNESRPLGALKNNSSVFFEAKFVF